jgi:hypothetical protein
MSFRNAILTFISILVILACNKQNDEYENPELKAELEQYAGEYMTTLKSILVENLKAGGPLQAVNVCSDTAAKLTAAFSEERDVKVKRFSYMNRNQDNYPANQEKEILNHFENLKNKEKLDVNSHYFKSVDINGKTTVIYSKPIFIGAPCLNCHGNKDQVSSNVRAVIDEKYPNDKATNYKIGDLRGAISVIKIL